MNESNSPTRVWLITGCSSGLGRALAQAALAQGDRVLATARRPETLQSLASEFPETCRTLALDVTKPEQVRAAVAQVQEEFGRLDVLVNNAGYGLLGAFEELEAEQIERNFAVNFFGALDLVRAALPVLRAQGRGHIVNISAAAVIANYAGFSIYGASKWALEGASESLALELKPLGIHVTCVVPGPFRTDFVKRSLDRARQPISDYERTSGKFARLLETMDGKQPGDPQRAAEAIVAAVKAEMPPFRLVLGKYANEKLRRKLADLEKERAAWEQVGLPTEFAPAS